MANTLASRSLAWAGLLPVFCHALMASSLAVARAAFARAPQTRSAILAVPIRLQTDFGIAMLANMVTLTPGTCSLHVSQDRRWLYVHALDAPDADAVVRDIVTTFQDRIARTEP